MSILFVRGKSTPAILAMIFPPYALGKVLNLVFAYALDLQGR
jgi:hypothetical protein